MSKVEAKTSAHSEDWLNKAGLLIEALPYMKRYANKPVVVKFGGHAMGEQEYVESFAADMTLLRQVGAEPIIVHGGGPQTVSYTHLTLPTKA